MAFVQAPDRPSFYDDDLSTISLDKAGLESVLFRLQIAISKGIDQITTAAQPQNESHDFGKISTGDLGVALAFLRLYYQRQILDLSTGTDLLQEARKRIDIRPADLTDFNPGRSSPILSQPLGAIVLRALSQQTLPQDPQDLSTAIEAAIAQPRLFSWRDREMGVDDMLAGRAGLLWGILEIYKYAPNTETRAAFNAVFSYIDRLVSVILQAGRDGRTAYEQLPNHRSNLDLPLMWTWALTYHSLGSVHGITGILGILLDPTLSKVCPAIITAYPEITRSITALCEICVENQGHLPLAEPHFDNGRQGHRVQICHGAPSILIMLAAAKRNTAFAASFWQEQWDIASKAAIEVVWKEGVLSKGCSLCHGLAGNGLSILLVVDPADDRTDDAFKKGLAMVAEAANTPPFEQNEKYRMPDTPWSMYEGLAGVLTAWAEACVLIKMKLRYNELITSAGGRLDKDEEFLRLRRGRLGFPGLVGDSVGGLEAGFVE